MWFHFREESLTNTDRAILVESSVVSKRSEEQLERLGFNDCFIRNIVDDQMRKIRLTGNWA